MANSKSADQFLNSLSDLDLILETKAAIQKERLATAVVIRYFQEIEDRKLYLAHSCSSLFEFATQHLGYCAGSAQARINAVRLMNSVPEVEMKIESGELSLTAVSKIQSFIYQEKKANKEFSVSQICEVIDSCANKSTREVERELAKRNPDVLKVEFVKPVGIDRFQLSFSVSEEIERKVRKLKGLLAHSNPNMTNEELFEYLVELGLEKLDPVRKAQRVAKRKARADRAQAVHPDLAQAPRDSARAELNFDNSVHARETESFEYEYQFEFGFSEVVDVVVTEGESVHLCDSELQSKPHQAKSRYISADVRDEVWLKNQSRGCEFVREDGRVCGSQHALQLDHVRGFALGGEHEALNLRVLCAKHNRFVWRASLRRSATKDSFERVG